MGQWSKIGLGIRVGGCGADVVETTALPREHRAEKLLVDVSRRNRRRKAGEDYDYWTLVQSVRTAKGPRQRIVAYIGKGIITDWQLLNGMRSLSESAVVGAG